MGTKMEIGSEAMHLRSRDLWYEGHATLVQSAARHPKIAQSYKLRDSTPKFQLFPGFLPKIPQK